MNDKELIKIYTTTDSLESGIFVSLLGEHGIESFVMNKQDSAYVSIGDIELFVAEEDVEKARKLIDDLRNQE